MMLRLGYSSIDSSHLMQLSVACVVYRVGSHHLAIHSPAIGFSATEICLKSLSLSYVVTVTAQGEVPARTRSGVEPAGSNVLERAKHLAPPLGLEAL